jgi:putative transposase
MKFAFIAKHRNIWPVAWLCEAMGVSRSGFHAWLNRSPSARSRSDEKVGQQVKASFLGSDRTYGARRVWRDLLADGVECGLHRIERSVIDLFSRRVVGWSMSASMTAQLVADALLMAVWRRGEPGALMHHSDRGSQYASEQFQRLMADSGIVCSMSRSGNVWDNAAMESFFSSLKTERIERKTYRTRNEARENPDRGDTNMQGQCVVAVYRSRNDAEQAYHAVLGSGVSQDHVRLSDQQRSERRPATGAAQDQPMEREYELREVHEEPVVQKDVRAGEELVVRKEAAERTETVADTVKKTKADIDKTDTKTGR